MSGLTRFVIKLGLVFVTLVLIALAIPSFLRRQVRLNDEAALECVRGVRDWEKAFAEVNGGLFAPPLCVLRPLACGAKVPVAPVTTPACLTAMPSNTAQTFTDVSARGYRRGRFLTTAGPSALSPTYLVTLEPTIPGKEGTQRIGVDEGGRICVISVSRDPQTLLDASGRLRTDCDSTQ